MTTRTEVSAKELCAPNVSPRGFKNAVRANHALTAEYEKRALMWMAQRTPPIINSDHLTALAFISQLFAGAAYALALRDPRALWAVNFFIFLNWLGDSLDGTLARVRNRQRPRYGFYVDHIVDTFGALALMIGLGCSGYLHWQIAVGMLVCFYALSIESYLATYATGCFHLSHGFFGPTEIRILLIAGNAYAFLHRCVYVANRCFLLFDLGGAAAIAAMTLMAVIAAIRHTVKLYREETP